MSRPHLTILCLAALAGAVISFSPAAASPQAAANEIPTVAAAIPDTVVLVDAAPIDNHVDLNDVFTDVEDGSALAFSILSNSNPAAVHVSIDADSALDLSFFPDTHGRATIVVRAEDSGGLFVDETFIVSVHRTLWLVKPDGSGNEPTIQAAINLSFDGDTILLADGTYTGAGNRGVSLGGRQIVVTSQNGAEATIIDLQRLDRAFIMDNVGALGVLSNITIKNGRQHQGACIKMSSASPTISGMILVDNEASMDGGAIFCDGGSSPTIRHCVLIGNGAASGGGIYSNASSPVVENCTVVESRATSGGAGIHMRSSSGARISNTIIAFGTQGPGIACTVGSDPIVSCTDIFGNAGGDALCGVDGGGNFSADPLFCGPPALGNVGIASNSPCAPAGNSCGVPVGASPVACGPGPLLLDSANTLYPGATFPGEPGLVLHIGLDNFSSTGVMLGTASSVTFSDSAHTFTSQLANPTYVPGGATNFTARFSPAAVPAEISNPASYSLRMHLSGVDDSAAVYDAAVTTIGRNSIFVDTPKVVVSALPLSVTGTLPGARNAPLLALAFQNGYGEDRALDSLVVTNVTFGPGTPADLDGEIESVHLFDDTDDSGDLSGPDAHIASSSLVAGEALFAVGGAWSVPALGRRNLIVTADIDSTRARDGDTIDLALAAPEHAAFQDDTQVNQDFSPLYPLNSFGHAVVDGMARHQIGATPAAADTLRGGDTGVWVFTLVIPQNGYETDTLTALSIRDYAGDFAPGDFAQLRLWRDNGDGAFNPASDLLLGPLVYSGDRYQISGLRETLAPSARCFIAADVSAQAVDGHHFRPGVPLGGIEVASSNDGPVDAPAVSAKTYAFENPEVVEAAGRPFVLDHAQPGARDVRMLHLAVRNRTRQSVTLDTLALGNASRGKGTPGDLDRTFANVRIYHDNGNGVVEPWDALVAEGLAFAAGTLVVPGIGLGMAPDETVHILVAADIDSFCAADGDTLAVRVGGPGDLGVTGGKPVTGAFPISTPGPVAVDGMRAFQIAVHPAADTLIVTGGSEVLLLDFGIPANGYAPDTLRTLVVRNEGTATSEHFERIVLWADGGNGAYDAGAGDDVELGYFVENPAEPGRSFLIAGLSAPLAGPCAARTRFFVAAEIAAQYSTAGTIRFSIPVMGVGVASGNDGPIDHPVVESSLMLIPKPDRLTIFPYPVGDQSVYPGSRNRLNAGVGFYNGYSNSFTLEAVKLYQAGTASSGEIDSVFVYADANGDGLFDPLADRRAGAVAASGVSYLFANLGVLLEPRKITYVFATYDLPLTVTDGATIDIRLFDPTDVAVEPGGPEIEGEFPINSPGIDTVDGMIARQIALGHVPPYNASPGSTDVPALNIVIPANGIWADRLEFITIENGGSAAGGSDIAGLRLWKEAGGDPERFDSGMEDPIDYLDWNGFSWRNASPLGVPLPVPGLRFYVTFTAAAAPGDGVTVRARVPVGGIEVASGNDGPIDAPVTNATIQTISTDPLIATLAADRASYSVGQTIVLSMAARNESPDTLRGVRPSALAAAGAGSAALQTEPDPAAVDLAPGAATAFVWTYEAAAAGDVGFCGRAWTADSSTVSEESCAEGVLLQNRPAGVGLTLESLAPSSVNRGQRGVKLFEIGARYTAPDTLAASVRLSAVALRFEDTSGSPLAPNSALAKIFFTAPGAASQEFSLADSSNPVLRLAMQRPVVIGPGSSLDLAVEGDIAGSASFTSFVLRLRTLGDVEIVDANDGTAVAAASAETFPWTTTPVEINNPAESLLVDSQSGDTVTVNFGQEDVLMFTVEFTHPGSPERSRVLLTDVKLGFFDLAGAPVAPASVVRRLRVTSGASMLFDNDVSTEAGSTLAVALQTPLVLSPGSTRAVDFRVDLRSLPQADGFRAVIAEAQSVVARDINTGRTVAVGPRDPAVRGFPFSSDRVVFENPASGVRVRLEDRLPAAILPSSRAVPVMDVVVSHENAAPASSVRIDSLGLEFSHSGGAPAFPGDYFSAVVVTHAGDTVYYESSLSGVSPLVGCRLALPVLVAPSEAETLCVFVDAKSLFSPASLEMRIQREGLVVRDANDGARIYGLAGEFPLLAGPTSLQIPTSGVSAALVSRASANITALRPDLEIFDLVLRNGGAAGFTPVELNGVRVRVQGAKGEPLDPAAVAGGARLVTRDSTVIEGTMTASSIDFALPAGLVRVEAGTSDTVSVRFDVDTDLRDASFRLVIQDSLWLDARDAVTADRLPVDAAGGRFPLVTRWIHVLGASAQSAYTNYPNPFAAGTEATTITYYLEQRSSVTLKVYTLWGAPVLTIFDNATQPSGLHQDVKWDGRNGDGDVVNNGVYYLVLDIRGQDGKTATLKRKVGVIR